VAAAKLKPCEQAIYYCCDPETNSALPLKCFEENKCAGLYWAGSTICSQAYIDKVTRKRKFVEVVEVVELEIGKNDDRANEIVEAVEIVGGDNETQKKPKHDQKKRTTKPKKKEKEKPSSQGVRVQSVRPRRPLTTIRRRRPRAGVQCSRAIVRCCDVQSKRLPLRCFEQNGCPGIYWQRKKPVCSQFLIDKAYDHLDANV